jgi:hypothetical protein
MRGIDRVKAMHAPSIALLMLILMPPAYAKPSSASQGPEIARCIQKAAAGRSWMERTLWGLYDQEGGWVGARIPNRDGSHDLGPLQINSWWVPRIARLIGRTQGQVAHWLQHDACFNVATARWIYLTGLAASRDYWRAVGLYHSPTPARQIIYMRSVATHLERRFGPGIFTPPPK